MFYVYVLHDAYSYSPACNTLGKLLWFHIIWSWEHSTHNGKTSLGRVRIHETLPMNNSIHNLKLIRCDFSVSMLCVNVYRVHVFVPLNVFLIWFGSHHVKKWLKGNICDVNMRGYQHNGIEQERNIWHKSIWLIFRQNEPKCNGYPKLYSISRMAFYISEIKSLISNI